MASSRHGVTPAAASPEAPHPGASRTKKGLESHVADESRYDLRGEVARGGMGAILNVWDRDLRRNLAMNVVLGQEDSSRTGCGLQPGRHPDPATSEELITLQGHDHVEQSVAFSPDGTQIASGSYDNTLRLWDTVATRERLAQRENLRRAWETVSPRIDRWFEEGASASVILSRLEADPSLTPPARRAARDRVLERAVERRPKEDGRD